MITQTPTNAETTMETPVANNAGSPNRCESQSNQQNNNNKSKSNNKNNNYANHNENKERC